MDINVRFSLSPTPLASVVSSSTGPLQLFIVSSVLPVPTGISTRRTCFLAIQLFFY